MPIRIRSRGWRWRGRWAPPGRVASVSTAEREENRTARLVRPRRGRPGRDPNKWPRRKPILSRCLSEFEAADGAGGDVGHGRAASHPFSATASWMAGKRSESMASPKAYPVAMPIRIRSHRWRWRGRRAPPGRVASVSTAEREENRTVRLVRPRRGRPGRGPNKGLHLLSGRW